MNGRNKVFDFLAHNNTIPLAIGILFLGASGAFAATDPEAVYKTESKVVSVDNSYIASKDLSGYTPRAQIMAVNEDTDQYYVDYQFSTIDVENGAWRDVIQSKVLKVDKRMLEGGETLGAYASRQLKEVVDAEYKRLQETQAIERRNITQKVVATEYGGLVGRLLDTTTQVEAPYVPAPVDMLASAQVASAAAVVAVPAAPVQSDSASSPTVEPSAPVAAAPAAVQEASSTTSGATLPTKSGALTLQVMGNVNARVAKNTVFVDLGVYVTDPPTNNIYVLKVFLNEADVSLNGVQLDTSEVGVHTIRYEASDAMGNKVGGSRTVTVYDPYAQVAAHPATEEPVSAPSAVATTTP